MDVNVNITVNVIVDVNVCVDALFNVVNANDYFDVDIDVVVNVIDPRININGVF